MPKLDGTYTDVKANGIQPIDKHVFFSGAQKGSTFWRSEFIASTELQPFGKDYLTFNRGDRLKTVFTCKFRFENRADIWNTIFQLHGPIQDGSYPGPTFAIAVQEGTFRIGGGVAAPVSDTGSGNFGGFTKGLLSNQSDFIQPYPKAENDKEYQFEIDTYLEGPGKGTMSIYLNGMIALAEGWKMKAGTMYPEHQYLYLKYGDYGGCNTEEPSTTEQSIAHWDIAMAHTSNGRTVTYNS